MMSYIGLICVSVLCVSITLALLWFARGSFERLRINFRRISKLEKALSNPEVVDIVQRMIREPLVENPRTFVEKRKNRRHTLLRIKLHSLIADKETRSIIYSFVKMKTKR